METRNVNWKLILAAVAVAVVLAWLFVFDGAKKIGNKLTSIFSNNKIGSPTIINTNTNTNKNKNTTTNAWPYPIGKGTGSKANPSADVKSLQEAVNKTVDEELVVDGIWGDKTEKGLTKLRDSRIYTNGILDSEQFAAHMPTGSAPIKLTEDQVKSILNLAQACSLSLNTSVQV